MKTLTSSFILAASLLIPSVAHSAAKSRPVGDGTARRAEASSEGGSRSRSPNVLFIAIDDLNDWVSLYGGHPEAVTPHLEAFADAGAVVFQNAHCPGPVCGPSRSALLSGFMPSTTGVYGNSQNMRLSKLVQQQATLPEYFSKHGYHSLSRGKIYHAHTAASGRDSGQWAFDEWVRATGGTPVDRNRVTSRNRNLIAGKPGPPSEHTGSGGSEFAWGPTVVPTEETKDYLTALWTAERLQDEFEKPFFMAVGISRPHLPFYAPQEFFDLYDPATFKAPERRENDLDDILTPSGKPKFRPTDDYLWLKQNGLIDECARAYMAASSYADACLGAIFKGLETSPHRDNTIVIIWGDHGWHLGEKLRYRKGYGWSESTRVPLLVRLPGMTRRQDCERAVNLIDFYPTLIELCALPAKPVLDGRSFAPLLEDPDARWNHPSVTVMGNGNASVRHDHWRFIQYSDGTMELYNLDADPMEWANLIVEENPEHEAIVKRLRAFLPRRFANPVPPHNQKEVDRLKKSVKGYDETIKATRPLDQLQ